jgi:hypothetical protein
MMNRKKKSQRDYALMASSASFPFYGSAGGLRVCLASSAVEQYELAIDVFETRRGGNIKQLHERSTQDSLYIYAWRHRIEPDKVVIVYSPSTLYQYDPVSVRKQAT